MHHALHVVVVSSLLVVACSSSSSEGEPAADASDDVANESTIDGPDTTEAVDSADGEGDAGDATDAGDGNDASFDGTPDGGAIAHWVDTWEGVHAFLTFDYQLQPGERAATAPHYDFVWGGEKPLETHAGNPKVVVSGYMPWQRDPDRTHSLAWWQTNHPDWVLYQCDRVTPADYPGDPNVALDTSNPAVVAWQVDYASRSAADAMGMDNFGLANSFHACGHFRGSTWVPLYSGAVVDPTFASNALAWLRAITAALHAAPHPMLVIPNYSVPYPAANDADAQLVVRAADGILVEGGFMTGTTRLQGAPWVDLVDFIAQAQPAGHAVYVINEPASKPTSRDDLQWILASYLMAKGHGAGVYASPYIAPTQYYGYAYWFPEYAARIGHPCAAMRASGTAYVRDYSHGIAIANPSTSRVTVTLPTGAFVDLYGGSASSTVSLAATSGVVLLASGSTARCP